MALIFAFCLAFLFSIVPAAAQQPPPATDADTLLDLLQSMQGRIDVQPDRWRFVGQVDLPVPGQAGARLFADQVELLLETNVLVAEGNVAFTGPEGRIAAERVEFNLRDGTASFHVASGVVSVPDANPAEFGNQDPDVYF